MPFQLGIPDVPDPWKKGLVVDDANVLGLSFISSLGYGAGLCPYATCKALTVPVSLLWQGIRGVLI